MIIPFGVQSYQHRSLPLSAQRLVNCYLEAAPPDAKTAAAIVSSYGISEFAEGSSGVCRGGFVRNGVLYAVINQSLVSVSEAGAVTTLGIVGGTGSVQIVGDEVNLMIVTTGSDYTYNGTVVSAITDPDYPGADWVAYLDGYYIISSGGQFYISANRDPTSWDALDFASAEKAPDDILVGVVDHSELILFGRETGEVWYNSGDADFPLAKAQSGDFETGIYSREAVAKTDNTVFFLGNDGIFYRLNGYTPQRVSTAAIEQAIEDADDKNFRCMSWKEGGHVFISVGSADFTFIYDVSTQLWHERKSANLTGWRAAFVVLAYNRWMVGDSQSSKIGLLDPDEFSEFGDLLRASGTAPSISDQNKVLRHGALELVFEQGVGISNGQGSDPQVMLRFSDDGGRTWSNERWRSLGKMGEYRRRAKWNRNGAARDRVYEYAISDPVRRTLILATADIH